MTKEQVLDVVAQQDQTQRLRWLLTLGWELTIAARGSYSVEGSAGHIGSLVGFNELQHQIYNFVRRGNLPEDWPLADLLETLFQKAKHYKIGAGLDWAFEASVRDSRR